MPRATNAVIGWIEIDDQPGEGDSPPLVELFDDLIAGEAAGTIVSIRRPRRPEAAPRLLEMEADLNRLLGELDEELAKVSRRLEKALEGES